MSQVDNNDIFQNGWQQKNTNMIYYLIHEVLGPSFFKAWPKPTS